MLDNTQARIPFTYDFAFTMFTEGQCKEAIQQLASESLLRSKLEFQGFDILVIIRWIRWVNSEYKPCLIPGGGREGRLSEGFLKHFVILAADEEYSELSGVP